MGFSKRTNVPEVTIKVDHPWHEGQSFFFDFPKRLPQVAVDAEQEYIGLKETEQKDAFRVGLIKTVAAMLLRPPSGFDDFPQDERPLAERTLEYFDDAAQVEFESVIIAAWRGYRMSAVSSVYLKSSKNNGARADDLSGVSAPPQSGL